jgi:hypothetical protein
MPSKQKLAKASSIENLRRVCRPEPLTGEELDVFFVETDEARDPHRLTRNNIEKALEDETVSLLFYGHRGCGKSTELNKFLAERKATVLPVQFSVLEEMTPTSAQVEDLVLVIIERLLTMAEKEKLALEEDRLEKIYDWFAETTRQQETGRDTTVETGAGVDVSKTALGKLLGLFAHFKGEVKFNAASRETSIFQLRKRPSDLIDRANEILRAIPKALEEKGDNRQAVVIVEDMDKLDLKEAREIYVNRANLLTSLHVRAVYTIPIYLFHSPDANAFRDRFTSVLALPMIKVREPDGSEVKKGIDTVKQIVWSRIECELIEEQALKHLVLQTGGVLRHVFQVFQIIAAMKDVQKPIGMQEVKYALAQVRRELWQMIALPHEKFPGVPESVEDLYGRLVEYTRIQRDGKRPPCDSDAINQILLKSCALVEYNGEGWFGVHPLVEENLEMMGRL